MSRKPIETKRDRSGPLRVMAEAEGFLMVRRPYCNPMVISRGEWDALTEEQTVTVHGVRE